VGKPISLRSVNGPQFTVIQGYQVLGTNGDGAIRCVYLTNGASLSGFTVSNGATRSNLWGDFENIYREQCGGGVLCESTDVRINNCTLTGNSAYFCGGGVYSGTLNNCTLAANVSDDSGGGAYLGTLNNCTLTENSAYYAGGAFFGELNNCTLTGNTASIAGGAAYSTVKNSILYSNIATNGANYLEDVNHGILNSCCTTPMPTNGFGNITNAPLFVDQVGGNLRLQSNSPCINAGNNAYVAFATDLDGNLRIQGGTVDIGAFEFQTPASILSYAWAQQYGLATDGSADFADADSDGLSNWQEWLAGTIPTNAASALRLLSPVHSGTGTVVSWQSVAGRTYFVERSTNLAAQPAFVTMQSNIAGLSGVTSYTDTNAIGAGPFFYRVGLQQ
jgi:hypothetical protein